MLIRIKKLICIIFSVTMDYFRRGDIHPREETMVNEFKGHRSFCVDEIPRLALSGFNNPGNRPSRQHISKYACGMLNTGRGGTIFMGILDDGRIDGFMMSKYQQDHVRLSIQDTFDRYAPPVPPHLYKITFKPVIDNDPQVELRAIYDYYAQEDGQNRELNHLIQASDHCWCDANSMAMFSRGCLNPFFVIELKLQAWNPDDPLNKGLFEEGVSKPKFKAEDGIAYIRKFGSNHAMTDDQKV